MRLADRADPRDPTWVYRPISLTCTESVAALVERTPSLVNELDRLDTGSALVVITHGPNTGARIVVDRSSTIGRHPGCSISLDDAAVSRRHAEVRRHRDGFVVADKLSLNGTYLNGHKITRPQQLRDADSIQIGTTRLVFLTGIGQIRTK